MRTLDQIVRQLAALPDEQDIPLSWTRRQLDDLRQKRCVLDARLTTARRATSTLAEVGPQIATLTKWRDHLAAWRATLCDRLVALAPAHTAPEFGQRQTLELSITRIDQGLDLGPSGNCAYGHLPLDDLMRDAGYVPRDLVARAQGEAWLGCMPDVERRIAELQKRHDDAQARLTEALLSDAERAKVEPERAARAAAFNAMTNAERKAAHNRAHGRTADGRSPHE
jgi:hypothetical protein